LHIIEIN